MILTLNYCITAVAYFFAAVYAKKGKPYHIMVLFMLSYGTAAMLGGFVHSAEAYEDTFYQIRAEGPDFFKSGMNES